MTISKTNEYRGRKQKPGSIVFTETGRLHYFIGYCPDCRGKCSVSPDEARLLIRRFGKTQNRPMQKLAVKMLKRYAGINY